MSTTTTIAGANAITLAADDKPKMNHRPQSNKSHNANRKTKIILEEDTDDSSKFLLQYYSHKIPAREDVLEWVACSLIPYSMDERVTLEVFLSGRTAEGEPQMLYEFVLDDSKGRFLSGE